LTLGAKRLFFRWTDRMPAKIAQNCREPGRTTVAQATAVLKVSRRIRRASYYHRLVGVAEKEGGNVTTTLGCVAGLDN